MKFPPNVKSERVEFYVEVLHQAQQLAAEATGLPIPTNFLEEGVARLLHAIEILIINGQEDAVILDLVRQALEDVGQDPSAKARAIEAHKLAEKLNSGVLVRGPEREQ